MRLLRALFRAEEITRLFRRLAAPIGAAAAALTFGWAARSPFVALLTFLILLSRRGTLLAALTGLALSVLWAAIQFTGRSGGSEILASWFYWAVAAGALAELVHTARSRWVKESPPDPDDEGAACPAFAEWRRGVERLQAALREPAGQARLARAVQRVGAASLVAACSFLAWARPPLPAAFGLLLLAGLTPFLFWSAGVAGKRVFWRREVAFALLLTFTAGGEVIFPYVWERPRPQATPVFNFLEKRGTATLTPARPGLQVRSWLIGIKARRVLAMRPTHREPARLAYELPMPQGALLTFGIGVAPETWGRLGDGITFKVLVEGPRGVDTLYERYLNPKARPQERAWQDVHLNLSRYAGETVKVIFVVQAGPGDDARHDLGGWAEPILWSVPR